MKDLFNRNKIAFFLFLLWSTYTSQAQVITIREAAGNSPLEGVVLASENPAAFAITNRDGQADIAAFRGASRIEIKTLGYQTALRSFLALEHDSFQLVLTPATLPLEEVVVSATRWAQPRREVLHTIATIGTSEVTMQNPQTAADMLGTTGQAFVQKSQQGGGSPMIRGFAANRVLIVVDGVRMNTAIFRSGNLQNVISIDPFALERTELLFGPGSLIYGSDALGGVMSFSTLSPRLAEAADSFVSGSATLRYASANRERTAHVHANTAWKKWALVSSFTYSNFGDLRMGSHGPGDYLRAEYVQRIDGQDRVIPNEDPRVQTPSGYRQFNLLEKLRFQPGKYWDLTLAFQYSITSDFDRYDRLLRYRNGLPRSAEWRYGPQRWLSNQFTASHKRPTGLYDEMALRIAFQQFEESRIERDFNAPLRRTRRELVGAYSLNLDFQKAVGASHQVFYGFEFVYNDVNSLGEDTQLDSGERRPGPSRYPLAKWACQAAYLSWRFRPSARWILQSGARFSSYQLNADFDNRFYAFPFETVRLHNGALTGNVSLAFLPGDDWRIRASLSTGFRSPNVDDMGKVFDSAPGLVVVPNPELAVEYAWSGELGVVREWRGWLKWELTAFYTLLDKAMVQRNFSLNGQDSILYDGELSQVQAVQNAASGRVAGVQAGLDCSLLKGLFLSSRFTWQRGDEELEDGTVDPLRHAVPWFGISRLSYSRSRWRAEAALIYCGQISYKNLPQEERAKDYLYARDAAGRPYSPAWAIFNLKAEYKICDGWFVNAGLENLADRRYRPYSSGVAAAGRNFILSMRANF
jgi:hemoglobin/transferrin/lactoferrin receptor protein